MMFGLIKRQLNQKAFYLDKDHIEITHKYKGVYLTGKRNHIKKEKQMMRSRRFFLLKSRVLFIY